MAAPSPEYSNNEDLLCIPFFSYRQLALNFGVVFRNPHLVPLIIYLPKELHAK